MSVNSIPNSASLLQAQTVAAPRSHLPAQTSGQSPNGLANAGARAAVPPPSRPAQNMAGAPRGSIINILA